MMVDTVHYFKGFTAAQLVDGLFVMPGPDRAMARIESAIFSLRN